MKGLQELNLDYVRSQATDSWWNLLNELCLPAQVFEIGIKLERERILFQLDNCFRLIRKNISMESNTVSSKRELHIHVLDEDDYLGLIGYNVRLTRAKDKQNVAMDPYSFDNVSMMDILELSKQYQPNSIQIAFEDVGEIYQTFLTRDVGDNSARSFLPAERIKGILIQHHNVDISNSWEIVNKACHLLDQAQQASLHLRNMILLDTELSNITPIKNLPLLSLDTCILQHNVLSKLSSMVHRIDKLEISSSAILMDEPHVLKLFLPFTAIRTLSLIIRPLLPDNSFLDQYFENCYLENLEAIKAVSLEGRYTLKIDTKEKTYVRQGKGSQILKERDPDVDIATGTKENFLIWIKCLNLDEFQISNNWDHDGFKKIQ